MENSGVALSRIKKKYIAVKFDKLPEAHEASLCAFINRELMQKNVAVDSPEGIPKNVRDAFRVVFSGVNKPIKVITKATQSIPQQTLDVEIQNLSAGGCSLCLPDKMSVVKGGAIQLTLDFCEPPILVNGTILGLRSK
jgi:hypothetical protein